MAGAGRLPHCDKDEKVTRWEAPAEENNATQQCLQIIFYLPNYLAGEISIFFFVQL